MKLVIMMERIATRMRLPPPPIHQAMIPINENPRRRKSRSPIQEQEDQESDDSIPQNPNKILRLFGFDIPIPQDDQQAIIPQNPIHRDYLEAIIPQNPIHQDDQEAIIPQNPNVQEEEAMAPIPPPPSPQINQEGGEERIQEILFEKEMTSSDVARAHNRLLITRSQRLMEALTEEERGRVELNRDDFLRVETIDEIGRDYTLRLKKWAGSGAIVLKHKWGKFVRANELQIGDLVRGWGYRVDGEFRLELEIIRN